MLCGAVPASKILSYDTMEYRTYTYMLLSIVFKCKMKRRVPIPLCICGICVGTVDAKDPGTETLLSRAFPHSAHWWRPLWTIEVCSIHLDPSGGNWCAMGPNTEGLCSRIFCQDSFITIRLLHWSCWWLTMKLGMTFLFENIGELFSGK